MSIVKKTDVDDGSITISADVASDATVSSGVVDSSITTEMTNITDASKAKRLPGRPRKQPVRPVYIRGGIMTMPTRRENVMEMMYEHPIIFKKIFCILFKLMGADEVRFRFLQDRIQMLTRDHYNRTDVLIIIDATKLNYYYCHMPYDVYIKAEPLRLISHKVNKNYGMFIMYSSSQTMRSTISFVFQNSQITTDDSEEVSLISAGSSYDFDINDFNDAEYPIQFSYESKIFKQLVASIQAQSETVSFEKIGTDPLMIRYGKSDSGIKAYNIFRDPSKIKLHCSLGATDVFSVSTKATYLKPFAVSLLSDEIMISLHATNNIILRSTIDNGTIKMYARIRSTD